ncbi:HDC15381 [Arctopsyche grandis]|uniref:HDC15381 n=1 Tax=Arctopsyche grandis TaxID=121162 RepID=UPI00406D8526
MMWQTSVIVGVLSTYWLLCRYCSDANDFSGIDDLHHREKRNLPLVFPLGGTFKLLLGWAIPIKNPANVSLVFGFNFQFQYPVPPNITFFDKYFPYVNVARRKRDVETDLVQYEQERRVLYHSLENSMNHMGINGTQCMLRTICEASEAPIHHDGYFGELLHHILSPRYDEFSDNSLIDYGAARKAGENFYDCKRLYPHCPNGHGLFDLISVLE